MNYVIRKLKQDEVKKLDTFLYEAIFIPEGVEAPPMEIINQPGTMGQTPLQNFYEYVKAHVKGSGTICYGSCCIEPF